MSIHITSTHWGRDLCPQVFKNCPAFRVSEKNYVWGLLAFAEFQMLIWCPGIVRVFLVHGGCFYEVSMGCPSSQPLHSVRLLVGCWPFISSMWVHSWSLGDATKFSHPAGFAWGWPWGPNNSLQTPLGHWSWQRENSLGDAGSREGDMREQRDSVGSAPVQMCCCHIHKGYLIAVTLWNALIFTESHKIDRVGGDFVVDKVLGEFLRVFIA